MNSNRAASHKIEKLVRSHSGLAELDRKMSATYQCSLKVLEGVVDREEATQWLKATQRGWVKSRNDCWKEEDETRCTKHSYETRIVEQQTRYQLIKGGKPVFLPTQ